MFNKNRNPGTSWGRGGAGSFNVKKEWAIRSVASMGCDRAGGVRSHVARDVAVGAICVRILGSMPMSGASSSSGGPDVARPLDEKTALGTVLPYAHRVHFDRIGLDKWQITDSVVAEKTGVAKKFSPAMFNYLQTQRATISTEKDIKNVFVLNGGDGDKFDKAFNNFSIVSQAKRNKKEQDKLNKARHLKSVPTFVVNGKYLINSRALDQKNFIADYQSLISYLFTLK